MVLDPAVSSPGYALSIACFIGIRKFRVWLYGEGKGATFVDFARNPYLSAVGLDNGVAEIQPEPRAADLRSVTVVAVKFIENVWQNGDIDAETKVFDTGLDHALFVQDGIQVDFARPFGIFDCIIE